MSTLRVLVVASTFPLSAKAETPTFVRDLIVALKQAKPQLKFTVLAPQYENRTSRFTSRRDFDEYRFGYFWPRRLQRLAGRGIVPTIENNPFLLLLVPFLFASEFVALLRLARKLRPDVIYAHWFTPQGVNAALVSIVTGIPYVLTTHSSDVRIWRKIPYIGPALVRWLLPRARNITAVSPSTRDNMMPFFSPDEWQRLRSKIEIIPMGVDVAAFHTGTAVSGELKKQYGLEDRQIIYFIGRLAAKKGVNHLLDAMKQVTTRNVLLLVAGDGPCRSELEEQSARLELSDTVEFLGYVSGKRKFEYFSLANVVVVPSVETATGDKEGFPVVIMESMAAGKICIASDATGAEDLLEHGHNSFIVPQRDPAALANMIDAVLALEPGERDRIGKNARQDVALLDWAHIAWRHYDFLFSDLHGADRVS